MPRFRLRPPLFSSSVRRKYYLRGAIVIHVFTDAKDTGKFLKSNMMHINNLIKMMEKMLPYNLEAEYMWGVSIKEEAPYHRETTQPICNNDIGIKIKLNSI